ncbi:two-component response regulator receiver [Cupriavidus basilensis OR16]|uniref:Two-component response regulator receiver n=1 Tax=Cupriavidus basilensis OR16 TaxID=1127483 RepID=H1SD96_9BURK|nr:response regulator [Cupriavidus basilensis]EHP39465.1 two-component response regulator receiver [Cupriavidus basilensis OR16]
MIAIVDDDAAVRQALGSLLRSFNMGVELYASGNDLLQSKTIDAISCLVTDVQMPAMNGFALCELLRARGFSTPVIFMTAFPEERYRQRAEASGAVCFLSKPFMETDIIRCIGHVLAQSAGSWQQPED